MDTNGRKLSPQEEAKFDLQCLERAAKEVQKYCQKHGMTVVITPEEHTMCAREKITVSPAGKKH